MIRIVILVAVILGVLGLHGYLKAPAAQISKRLKQFGWLAALVLLASLMLTGKLNGLLAVLGVMLAFLLRSMPVILKYAPQLHGLWQRFVAGRAQAQNSSNQSQSAGMTKTQALQVLGLKSGASEEDIVQAHRKLISRVHPDRGGSDYLAAQINLAKKILLDR